VTVLALVPTAMSACGHTIARPSRFDNMPARYNIAPTQDVAVMRLDAQGQRQFAMLRWGLIPYWAKGLKIAFSTINAMAETLATKPAFREAFVQRRCLVLADYLSATSGNRRRAGLG
jgi:putative SOS response-associated peptidase YedK